jgi:hypothetical protein
MGIITGFRVSATSSTWFGVENETVLTWIDDYCRAHPRDLLTNAPIQLARALLDRENKRLGHVNSGDLGIPVNP